MYSTPISLLQRLRTDADASSWAKLLDLYIPLMRHWFVRLGVPSSDIDDLVQEVCTAMSLELPHFELKAWNGAFRRWIRTIVVNRAKGYWRAKKRHPQSLDHGQLELLADSNSEPSLLWDREHDQFIARRLMEIIRPDFAATTWQAFRRQVIDGVPAAEVARELRLSINSVLIAKSRVLRKLRLEGAGIIDSLE